jgi:hypothetical protein
VSAVARASRTLEPWAERLPSVKRRHDHDDLQRDICQFLDLALPPDATYFHVPNGGLRSKREAARLKGIGVVAGVPDICIIYRGRSFFLELKAGRDVMSRAQKDVANKLNYCGANVMLVRSLAECEAALREACVPLRATVA